MAIKDLRQRLLATFHGEHREHVQRIRETLASIDPSAPPGPELDDAFRRAHSLKGASRAVDLRQIEQLTHRLETLFSRLRGGVMTLEGPVIGVIQQVLDASEDCLTATTEGREPAPPVQALEAIDRLLGTETPAASPAASPAATIAAIVPAAAAPAAAIEHLAPARPIAAAAGLETIRLNAVSLDRIVNSAGQVATESLRQQQDAAELRAIGRQLADVVAERSRARRAGARAFQQIDETPALAAASRYVNYVDHQLDRLVKQVGAATRRQAGNAWTLKSLAGELQRDVQQARMVPVEDLFGGFPKMVRDVARDEGKGAALHVSGWQVEADRMVLQALKDPVMHMLRNAVSHGIEPEAERTRAGKQPEGRIDLGLDARGNRLHITIEDDGRGIDVAAVTGTAIGKGMLDAAQAAARPAEDLMRLILLPGFSTRRVVTETSGRGMGLSVVAEAVTRLQGTIDIGRSKAGGTRLTIVVPLSVSTHRLLLVGCAGQTLGIPVHAIERLHRLPLSDVQRVESKPIVMLDGQPVPVVSLAHLIHAGDAGVSAAQGTLSVLVLRAGTGRLAVAVDTLLSERDAIIKDLPPPADRNTAIAGGILLEDGSVCLVLNPAEIVEGMRASADGLVIAGNGETPAAAPASNEILIVDDSVTTRTLEKIVLEAHGYQVAVAVDGVEALAYLRAQPVSLVITDIEMPRLDGFGLIEEMKRDTHLARVPVIIVSSLESADHQARGMALGADAYVVKRKFEQRELLDTIRQIL